MIGISTIIASSTGDLVIYERPDSVFKEASARVSRTATLDGGVAVVHSGFSHGDRTFRIRARLEEEDLATLENIHQEETVIYLSCKEGFFEGAIERITGDGGDLDMTFLVKERLDE